MIATFHSGMTDDAREEVKRAFNADPARHPLRVLIAIPWCLSERNQSCTKGQ